MELFYDPQLESNHFILNEPESNHCIQVLRKKKGDVLTITDGNGHLYTTSIEIPDKRKCQLKLIEKISKIIDTPNVHIAISPTKNIDRFEWFLEKSTEIGITEVTPVLCMHSERKHIRNERLEKVIISAMKQSVKLYKPKLNEMISFADFIKKTYVSQKFVAHCAESERSLLKNKYTKGSDVTVLIGPEGDFSPEEIQIANDNNFIPISLGKSRLRTETAGIVTCSLISSINEE